MILIVWRQIFNIFYPLQNIPIVAATVILPRPFPYLSYISTLFLQLSQKITGFHIQILNLLIQQYYTNKIQGRGSVAEVSFNYFAQALQKLPQKLRRSKQKEQIYRFKDILKWRQRRLAIIRSQASQKVYLLKAEPIQLINSQKLVARIMKPYESEEKIVIKQTPKKSQEILKLEPIVPTGLKTDVKQMEEPVDSGQREDSNEKFSMSRLCQAFIERCTQSLVNIFETKTLVEDFGVKQRRIYDLMNIMEGCGCLKKLSKGKYQWVGIENSEFINAENQKGDSTSLRQIAARIKLLFSQTQGIISFSQINQLLLTENKERTINPSSIRRRIYECCKVLRILGFIDKIGKNYQWVYNSEQPRTKSKAAQIKKTSGRRLKRSPLSQSQLINEIIRRYQTVDKINEFIQKLTATLNSSRTIKKQEVIFQE